jgi:hypothetical protein
MKHRCVVSIDDRWSGCHEGRMGLVFDGREQNASYRAWTLSGLLCTSPSGMEAANDGVHSVHSRITPFCGGGESESGFVPEACGNHRPIGRMGVFFVPDT